MRRLRQLTCTERSQTDKLRRCEVSESPSSKRQRKIGV